MAAWENNGERKVANIHKLRMSRVAIMHLSLQGTMGENETWLEMSFSDLNAPEAVSLVATTPVHGSQAPAE